MMPMDSHTLSFNVLFDMNEILVCLMSLVPSVPYSRLIFPLQNEDWWKASEKISTVSETVWQKGLQSASEAHCAFDSLAGKRRNVWETWET
jgi:hypothetical protein